MSLELFSLEGKNALVTGASRGIGRAIALGFAEAGADVAVAARNEEDLNTLAKEIEGLGRRAVVIPTDVTQRDQIGSMVQRTVDELGGLDILVNNAGGTRFMSPIVALRPEGRDKAIKLNLDSVFHATQFGAQAMLAGSGGSIIQMSSVAGIQGAQTLSYYSAAKAGVRMMSQAIAKELATSNIRVNSIAPGWVATDLNAFAHNDENLRRSIEETVPMQRFAQPEEIVGAAVFLASEASSYITGTTIVIDGGVTA